MTLLDAIAQHLAAVGIARLPGTGTGPRPWLPPFWRNPADGTPAPGEKKGAELDDGLVLAGYLSGEIPPPEGGGYSNRLTVDVDLRSKSMASIETVAEQLREEFAPSAGGLVGAGIPGLRIDWTLQPAGPAVIESRLWRGLQILGSSTGQGYHYRLALLLELYR